MKMLRELNEIIQGQHFAHWHVGKCPQLLSSVPTAIRGHATPRCSFIAMKEQIHLQILKASRQPTKRTRIYSLIFFF